MREWTEEEKKDYAEKHGAEANEQTVAAMGIKELFGPIMALVNQQLSGEELTKAQIEWLNSPLPPLAMSSAGAGSSADTKSE